MFTFLENIRPDLEDLEQSIEDVTDCHCKMCDSVISQLQFDGFGVCRDCYSEIRAANLSELLTS
jgi:hypothetical protein